MDAAVSVRDANKFYGSQHVLDNLSMNVSRGSIYGLLGASGCGKTTLLSCIVGIREFNSGELWVLGGKPGTKGSGVPGPRVGYMPQEVALCQEFSVKDAVYYFGRIFGMEDKLIEERFRNLSNLLELPPDYTLISQCSGGQQRRVSLASSMVNNPELLILDEPTVGLDPILRNNMWNYFMDISQKYNTAVIITTHYIEEARQAHRVGLMRHGKLIAEDSPDNLLVSYGADTLEAVFLQLSAQQTTGRLQLVASTENPSVINSNNSLNVSMSQLTHGSTDLLRPPPSTSSKNNSCTFLNVDKHRVKALLGKHFMQIRRNVIGSAFVLMYAFVQVLAFFVAVGHDVSGIKLGIVNDEIYMSSCANFSFENTVVPYNYSYCDMRELGCRFLTELDDPMIDKIFFDDIEKAVDDVKHGKITGALYIPRNFSAALRNKIMDGTNIEEEDLEFGAVSAWMDMSNRQVGLVIKFKLIEKFIDFSKKVLVDCDFPPKTGEIPVRYEEVVYGEKNDQFTIFMIPGVLITTMFFCGSASTATAIVTDRVDGIWNRSIVAGVSAFEILITHLVTQISIMVLQQAEIMFVAYLFHTSVYVGGFLTITLLIFLQGVVGLSFGLLLSVVSTGISMVFLISVGLMYISILICGLMWPLEGMPAILRYIGYGLPFTVPILSFRNVMAKGFSIFHPEVINGIAIEIFYIVFLITISLFVLRTKR